MKKITVYGKEYPMRLTMGALRRFKRETGTDISQMGTDVSLMAVLLFCCVVSACNADNVPFDLDLDKFADGVDMEAMSEFAESLTAGNKDDESKKKEKEKPPQTSTN